MLFSPSRSFFIPVSYTHLHLFRSRLFYLIIKLSIVIIYLFVKNFSCFCIYLIFILCSVVSEFDFVYGSSVVMVKSSFDISYIFFFNSGVFCSYWFSLIVAYIFAVLIVVNFFFCFSADYFSCVDFNLIFILCSVVCKFYFVCPYAVLVIFVNSYILNFCLLYTSVFEKTYKNKPCIYIF